MSTMLRSKYNRYVIIHVMLFIFSCIIGIFVGGVVGNIGEIPFLDKPFYEYFYHNLWSCIILIMIGVATYGFLTWIPLVYNGIILGMAINFLSYHHSGLSILAYFTHAIFEIPALMLSIYLGKLIAVEVKSFIIRLVKHEQIESETIDIKNIMYLFFLMILFLFFASIIEAIPK